MKSLTKILLGLTIPVVMGIYTGRNNSNDLWPIYSHKTGDSYGINVALFTDIDEEASVNGLNLSLHTRNYGTINGANIAFATSDVKQSKINGLEFSLVNGLNADYEKSENNKITGLQIGLYNESGKLNGAQIEIYNVDIKSKTKAFLLNVRWDK